MTGKNHPVDEILPPTKLFTLGLQHVLVMYAGAIAVPLVVAPPTKVPAVELIASVVFPSKPQ